MVTEDRILCVTPCPWAFAACRFFYEMRLLFAEELGVTCVGLISRRYLVIRDSSIRAVELRRIELRSPSSFLKAIKSPAAPSGLAKRAGRRQEYKVRAKVCRVRRSYFRSGLASIDAKICDERVNVRPEIKPLSWACQGVFGRLRKEGLPRGPRRL